MAGDRKVGPPASYVVAGVWPNSRLSGPRIVSYAQQFAARLESAIAGRSLRDVARAAGLSHTTLLAVLAGDRWPDMVTIAKLEDALGADLWPGQDIRRTLGPAN
jgi:lambda repressor-like predicted transcriptional regulator